MNIKNSFRNLFVLAIVSFIANGVFAQDCADFTAFPGGEEEGKKMHVLYRDLMEKEQYDEAMPMWKQLYESSPAGNAYHYIDGIALYTDLALKADEAEDTEKGNEYKEKIIEIYDARLACKVYKSKGVVLEAKAYSMSEVSYEDYDKTLEAYKAVIEENGNKTSAYIMAYYADHVIWMFGNDLTDKETARDVYMTLEAIKDANTENEDYAENWTYVEDYYQPYLDNIFDCDFFKTKLKVDYDADPDNPDVFRPILVKLFEKGCTKEDPFMAELIKKDELQGAKERDAAMERWKTEEPDKYGLALISKGQPEEATQYLKKGIAMDIGADRLSKAHYALAQMAHKKGQYGTARTHYNAAANNRPGWGDPYLQIGKMYASSVRSCGNGDGFQQGVVVCAALDMWGKAKSVDGSVAGEANSLIGKYSGSVPTKEDAFQRGVKAGQSASVGCWIGGSATVRLRSQY
ncbi:MAG: hypothetical protein AB8G11_20045 [Saprospiraceae bacterium]